MSNLGRYCKAYYLRDLRAFSGWSEPPVASNDPAVEASPAGGARPDDAIVYLHENFTVTDGIALDEGVIFSRADEEWTAYCRDVLRFEVPAWCADPALDQSPEPVAAAG